MTQTVTERAYVKILLNKNGLTDTYDEGDEFCEAHDFWSGLPACGVIERLLTIVWEQLNAGAPRADWALEYRRKGNRSLRYGDVIVVGETAYACESGGFRAVSVNADQVTPAPVDLGHPRFGR